MREWLAHPVTVAHRKRLARLSAEYGSPEGMGMSRGDSLEDLGLKAVCALNYMEGIGEAYGHDPEMFHAWLKEVSGE